MSALQFHIKAKLESARAGTLTFASGLEVLTPVFMPVCTQGTVKALSQSDLEELGYNLILGNCYHLLERPGLDVLEALGGLGSFISWDKAILTDSGGYQAFSLSKLSKLKEEGIEIRSALNGQKYFFSPEFVVEIQKTFCSNILMPIDDCAPYPSPAARLKEALDRTHRWLDRSKEHWKKLEMDHDQALFSIVQGGTDLGLRADSAEYATDLDLPGNAIGGLSVGEKGAEFREALQVSCENLPNDRPRYLMGVGSVPEMMDAIKLGVDMFDCVLPTRNARNGQALTWDGKVNLRNQKHEKDGSPLDEQCTCRVCTRYSRAYLRHLHKADEILASMLTSYHNLAFFKDLMAKIRESIQSGNWSSELEIVYQKYLLN